MYNSCKGKVKVKSVNYISLVVHQAGAYPAFLNMKKLEVFLLPSGWDASPLQGLSPSSKFARTHLDTWVKKGTVIVKCLA